MITEARKLEKLKENLANSVLSCASLLSNLSYGRKLARELLDNYTNYFKELNKQIRNETD